MYFNMDWQITVGEYYLALLAGCEIHKSVDLLADTCTITLPGFAYNKAFRVEQKIKRGDAIEVRLGYDGKLVTEFKGYLLNINTDDGSLTLNCEDDLFVLRKDVKDKQFVHATVKEIVQYCLDQTGVSLKLNCSFGDGFIYDKFVISKATAYDVLKKLQEETKANIYIRTNNDTKQEELNIHPLYAETHGYVSYSFQQNIEESNLKFKRAEDKRVEVIVESVGKDGKTNTVRTGTTGGDQETVKVYGMNEAAMKQRADSEYLKRVYDGYEGSVSTWMIPTVEPGDSADVFDEDFEFKNGTYYVTAVTTKFDDGGGKREVQLGIKLAALDGQISKTGG